MMIFDDDYYWEELHEEYEEEKSDPAQEQAKNKIFELFDKNREAVFFSRQVEVINEGEFFHWITNRALRELEEEGVIKSETRELSIGSRTKLYWHPTYRYYKRKAKELIDLLNEYTNPEIGRALGWHGEMMVLEGFARTQFVQLGRNTNSFGGKNWTKTNHDLDFIFQKNSAIYGVEVKNQLRYMDQGELRIKIELCLHLGVRPVFVVRMMPKTWIYEVNQAGGFVLVLKYQLYPPTHRVLARKVKEELGLPVDSPRVLEEGTIKRFTDWHERNVN